MSTTTEVKVKPTRKPSTPAKHRFHPGCRCVLMAPGIGRFRIGRRGERIPEPARV